MAKQSTPSQEGKQTQPAENQGAAAAANAPKEKTAEQIAAEAKEQAVFSLGAAAAANAPKEKTAEQIAAEAKEQAAKEAEAKQAAYEKSKKTDLLKHTNKTYVPEPGTEGNYHARIEIKNFDAKTGKRKSKPKLQIFAPKAWANFERNSIGLGYHVDILHDPTGKYPVAGLDRAEQEAKEAKANKE